MKKIINLFFGLAIIFGGFGMLGLLNQPEVKAFSQVTTFAATCTGSTFFGFPSWDSCLPKQDGQPVIKSLSDIWLMAFPIIETLIKAAGYMAAGYIIWGGIKYIKSNGQPAQIQAAQDIIRNAVIGMLICVLSVSVVKFIADRF